MRRITEISGFLVILGLLIPASMAGEGPEPLSSKEGSIEIFGRTFVYEGPPTFETDVFLQKGNENPQTVQRDHRHAQIVGHRYS